MIKIIQSMISGHELRPMESAGDFWEDGFVMVGKENGLTGFSEIMTGTILRMERRKLIFWNAKKWQYCLTKKGVAYGNDNILTK